MTTPKKQKHRTQPARRKRGDQLHPDVTAAIERAWPDGVIEMTFDSEESWFWDVHPKFVKALQSIKDASLREHDSESPPWWPYTDNDYGDLSYEQEFRRSYHLFFVRPTADTFTFETEIETLGNPQYDEDTGEEKIDDEPETITVVGREHSGWSVAMSHIAPFAVITLSAYSEFEDGSVSEPSLQEYVDDENGQSIHPESHFRAIRGEQLFRVLEKLRSRIVAILEKLGVRVLTEAEWRTEVPGLRSDGDVNVRDAIGQPVRVLDAFFFEGL